MITDLEVASIDVAILVGDLVAKQGRVGRSLVVDEDSVGAVALDESEFSQCVFETQAHFQTLVQGIQFSLMPLYANSCRYSPNAARCASGARIVGTAVGM